MNKLLSMLNAPTIKMAFNYLRANGLGAFIKQVRLYAPNSRANYNYYRKQTQVDKKTFALQASASFAYLPMYYILYPFDDTVSANRLIHALKTQSYQKWTLCLPEKLRVIVSSGNDSAELRVHFFENEGFLSEADERPDFFLFFDKNAFPAPDLLYEITKAVNSKKTDFLYFDEDVVSKRRKFSNPHFKPDYNYDMLMQYNYIGYTYCISFSSAADIFSITKSSLNELMDDFVLFAKDHCQNITHISKVLVHNQDQYNHKPMEIYRSSVERYFKYSHISASIHISDDHLRISYDLTSHPLVSIIIPNKDHVEELSACISSVLKSTYDNFEIIVLENNSADEKTFSYYDEISKMANISVIVRNKAFNFSAINNYAAAHASGDYLLFLNNDTEVISLDWIEEMLMYVQRNDVGIAGSLLLYPDNTIQHAGGILGIQGIAGHAHKLLSASSSGYFNRIVLAQDYSCVTAACMMIKRDIFQKVNGFDESFQVAFNDIDLCLKVRQLGYLIVYTPYSKLYHYESKSRGMEDTPEKIARFHSEIKVFRQKWQSILNSGDPYYNRNLTLLYEDFSLKRKLEYESDFSFFSDPV